jgi:predicted lipoprotein with Yx(FWY)xxD motif
MVRTLTARGLAAALAVAALAAGCGAGAGYGGQPSGPTATPAASAGTPSTSAGPAGTAYTVEIHQDATLGAFLTGEDGRSLYVLTKDSVGTSTCSGACATAWPPFLLEPGETVAAGSAVSGTLATITRGDGSTQVTINGLPLYYFAGDDGAGQTNGQGVNGVWFLVAPDGTTVGQSAGAGAPVGNTRDGY